jgi:hypothetical protein
MGQGVSEKSAWSEIILHPQIVGYGEIEVRLLPPVRRNSCWLFLNAICSYLA